MDSEETDPDKFGLCGHELDKKFLIDRVVAEGGFGVVYAGKHLGLDVPVAVKVLKTPPELGEQARAAFMEKFVLEAKTIARIKHPNIVQVLDTGVSMMPIGVHAPWMVLEWLTGQTFEELFAARRGRGGMSPTDAWALMRPAFEAMAYAHDEGIAHRDIKPGNIMLLASKRGMQVRLLDFGIAKLMQDGEQVSSGATATRGSFNAFSPNYAAPEQIAGMRTGPWTDVHALALMLTEALTDQSPYPEGELTDIFQEVLSPLRPTPAKFGVDVGPLEPVIKRALAYKSDERYRTAADFITALDEAIPMAANATHSRPSMDISSQPPTIQRASGSTVVSPTPTTLRGAAVTQSVPSTISASEPPKRGSRGPMIGGIAVGVAGVLAAGVYLLAPRAPTAPVVTSPATQPSAASTSPTLPGTPTPPETRLGTPLANVAPIVAPVVAPQVAPVNPALADAAVAANPPVVGTPVAVANPAHPVVPRTPNTGHRPVTRPNQHGNNGGGDYNLE